MNNNELSNMLHSDTNIKEAVRRHEQNMPIMSSGLNDLVLKRIKDAGTKKKRRRTWIYIPLTTAAAASILLVLLVNTGQNDAKDNPVATQHTEAIKSELVKAIQLAQDNTEAPSESVRKLRSAIKQANMGDNAISPKQTISASPRQTITTSPCKGNKIIARGNALGDKTVQTRLEEAKDFKHTNIETITDSATTLPDSKQTLANIYLAEAVLQVAYEQQAQAEALRAFAASLNGEDAPAQSIIAF